jgi:hypothetical protein
MLIFSVVCSLVLLVLASSLYKEGKPGAACGVSGMAILFGWPCFMLPGLMLTGAAMFVGGLVCKTRRAASFTYFKWSLTALAASHCILGIGAFVSTRHNAEVATKYPLESMAGRLAYMSHPKPNVKGAEQSTAGAPILLQSGAWSELSILEERIEEQLDGVSRMRDFNLRLLHDDVVTDFINSPGFGITRRIEPRSEYIELPAPAPIPLPAPPEYTPGEDSDTATLADAASAGGTAQSLRGLHEDGFLDFVNPRGFGVVWDRQRTRGFQVHHFRKMPSLAAPSAAKERWRVQRLELMSLLAHEAAAVYVSDHLPRMDELRDAPTRPLNSFETTALSALQSGSDLRFECSADEIQMLGSIRALKQCTTCHAAERGELLGAFSYTLRRVSSP